MAAAMTSNPASLLRRITRVALCNWEWSAWGRMGASLVRRLMRGGGHSCVVYDVNPAAVSQLEAEGATGAASLEEFVAHLDGPRAIWLMLRPQSSTRLDALVPLLSGGGDTVIDGGGNSYYRDDITRAQKLAESDLHYVDCGTSGGVWGGWTAATA